MKKFTALMLVVLMVVSLVPFGASAATTWTKVDTAEEFAAMTNGNYWLTADIDLSKVEWTTIKEFKGTLNGNGKTVTLPKDAPVFDLVTGTIKNVNLKGTVALTSADASDYYILGDIDGYPVASLANYAMGATLENVNTTADVTFTNDKRVASGKGYNVGGLLGFASGAFTADKDGKVTVTKATTITNCTVGGKLVVDYKGTDSAKDNRDNAGGVIGATWGNVNLKNVAVTADMTVNFSAGNRGGLIGHLNQAYYVNITVVKDEAAGTTETKRIQNDAFDMVCTLENCIFSGKLTDTNHQGERAGGFLGYGRGYKLVNCAFVGELSGNTDNANNLLAMVGYTNAGKQEFVNEIEGCLSTAAETDLLRVRKTNDPATVVIKNNIVIEGQTLNIAKYEGTDKNGNVIYTEADWNGYTTGTKTVADAVAAVAEMAKVSGYKVVDGKLTVEMPAFTPAADPVDPAPTGDMTVALVATALVSLAAVTVIAKKKVTE